MVDNKEVNIKLMNKLADWINNLNSGFRNGDVSQVLVELPDYYRDVDIKVCYVSSETLEK